jgi:tetratricopeptide (TPR) repeat protein
LFSLQIHRLARRAVVPLAVALQASPALSQDLTDAQLDARLAAEERECGGFYREGRNGPSDYRSAPRQLGSKLSLVENRHFTPGVRSLTRPSTGPFGDDLEYTLYSFPNHIPALLVMDRLAQREKTDKPAGATHTVDCYYRRAVRFTPDDLLVRIAYAHYLGRVGRRDDALKQLQLAFDNADDNGFTYYNIGLAYMFLKDYDRALESAHRAMVNGFERPDLKQQLAAVNRWRDPAPAGAESPASAPAGSASAVSP